MIKSPDGNKIIGTYETVFGTAKIFDGAKIVKGKIEFEYTGDTNIDWNSQKTVKENGERVFVDEKFGLFKEDEIIRANLKRGRRKHRL